MSCRGAQNSIRRVEAYARNHQTTMAVRRSPEALQAAADRFVPDLIRKRLEYWTFFSKRERGAINLHRSHQVEYGRNFVFKRNFPIHKIFERSCEIGLWRMTSSRISDVFGTRLTKKLKGK